MKAGISTACFYPKLTEMALDRLVQQQVKATELFFNAPSELESGFLAHLGRMAQLGGLEVLSVHPFSSGFEPFLLFSNYQRRTQDGFELYKRYFNAANLLGAKFVVIHGARREHPYGQEQYFDLFGELDLLARQQGVRVAQENVPRCISYAPAFFSAMSRYLPGSLYVLDVKQCLRGGCTPLEMAEGMGSGLCHLHLSDHTAENDCVLVGQGELDVPALLCALRARNGFDGGVLLEVYRDSYQEEEELFDSYREIERSVQAAAQRSGDL